jgi:uncharacterized protein YdhG (YjbR/CyaY superfamily)
MNDAPADIDGYIAIQPAAVASTLQQIRQRIRQLVPGVEETISYKIPTFTLDGKPFLHVAAWQHHLAIYPIPKGDEALLADLAPHIAGKGTLKFMLDRPFPFDLIDRIVRGAVARVTR